MQACCLSSQVKLILKFITYVAYNSLLELCFAMDEFAMPPPGSEELAENMEGFESSTDLNPTEIGGEEPMDISEISENHGLASTVAKNPDIRFVVGEEAAPEEQEAVMDVEYTSLMDAIKEEDEDFGKENIPPSQEHLSAATSGSSVEVPSNMKRQLSDVTELTDCSDPLLGYQKNQDDSIFKRSHSIQFQEQKQTMSHQFRHTLHGTMLSASPYIKYGVPFLESEAGNRCFVRSYLPDQIYWSALFTGEKAPKEQRLSKGKFGEMEYGGRYPNKSHIKITEAHPFVLSEMTAPANDNSTQVISDMNSVAAGSLCFLVALCHSCMQRVILEQICSDNFTCCYSEKLQIKLAVSQLTNPGPVSPSIDPVMPGMQGYHEGSNF